MLPRGCAKQTLRFTKAEDKMYVTRHQLDGQEVALLGGNCLFKVFSNLGLILIPVLH